MKLYNTLNRKIEDFIPNEENVVKMYTCGPTVYHYAHIGNLRSYIVEDVLEKGLNYIGYDVTRAMNITDVGHLSSDSDSGEDKMLKGAKRENKTVLEIAKMYTDAFKSDCEKLNIKWPEIVVPATGEIDRYIEIITELFNKGYAYQSGGNVYFDTSKLSDYYQLTNHNEDSMVVGVRQGVEYDDAKRNQADFALWFTKSKFDDQELKWDSPWGYGYPGWHIECSGISTKYLGDKLDIHCGGIDNIFPHHTNEIAQSESYLGHKWCNYWFHVEHLNDVNGKMSKSSGEFTTVSVLMEKGYDPLAYRYYCLGSHYRKTLSFSYESLDTAQNAYVKLKNKIKSLDRKPDLHESKIDFYQEKFKVAISDDLNTSMMLTVLYEVLKDKELSDFTKLYLIEDFDKVLGLNLIEDEKQSDVDEEFILKKIQERNDAKKAKNYELADEIRNELLSKNIKLIDTREGTTFEVL